MWPSRLIVTPSAPKVDLQLWMVRTAVFSGIALVVIALHKRPASTDGSDPAFGAGHSCNRFRLHDRRASYSSQCLDAPAIWCSVFPPSAPWPLEHIV